MNFEKETFTGKVIKRYKRFFADIELDSGEIITAHTPNTGSMKTCLEPGWKAMVTFDDNPKRKLKYTLELTHNGKTWIGVNTHLPNKLAIEAINNHKIKELEGYDAIKPEYKVGDSRLDLLLYNGDLKDPEEKCFVEIKNVTLLGENKKALFPDSVTIRGQKHLKELISLKKAGHRACMLFIVQRRDVNSFSPAKEIDPTYSELLKKAEDSGVEILVYQCSLDEKKIEIQKAIPYQIN
jgi:sugar fermentation stimulation protein A